MRKKISPLAALAGVMLGLLALTGSARAATATELHIAPGTRTVTLSPARVRDLVDAGARVQVSSKDVGLHPAEVRLFVYERVLIRGGQPGKPTVSPAWKMWISPLAHLRFTEPGSQFVTLHVDPRYRTSLLHAGSLTLGISALGY